MSDKERNRKEFRRLFGTFTLRAIDLEEMFCSLLNIQTMESSDVIYNIDLHQALNLKTPKEKVNIDDILEQSD